MKPEELAEFLGLKLSTIYNRSALIPGRQRVGNRVRFDRAVIEDWVIGTDGDTDLWESAKKYR